MIRAIPSSSAFHSSAILRLHASKKKGFRGKKLNVANTAKRLEQEAANRPHVVLGTRPSEEARKWKSSHLARILVNEDELRPSTKRQPNIVQYPVGSIEFPNQFAFGVGEPEKKMLFDTLPTRSLDMQANANDILERLSPNRLVTAMKTEQAEKELTKANLLARSLDLCNANADGIAYENRRRIIATFSTPENPHNPGLTEVQVALLTYQIRNLWSHLLGFRRDVASRRSLRKLVHQRAKLLRYLKAKSQDRYETILERLALEPDSVEGELTV